jgi:histidinol-phosphatase (PHP family)
MPNGQSQSNVAARITSPHPDFELNMSLALLYDTHSHTTLCKHADGSIEEYAQAAERAGLRGMTVTCHNPMPDGFSSGVRMDLSQFDLYLEMVSTAAARCKKRVDVRLGIEADYFPGYEDFLEKQLKSAPFDYVIGSVHPQLREFKERYFRGDAVEFQRTYFEQLAVAAETKLFDCISHPDLVKNLTVEDWQPDRVMDSICGALDRIAKAGVAMELNTSGRNKRIAEMNPFPAMLREMLAREIPVVIGSDAHQPDRVGEGFVDALRLLQEVGYEEVSFFMKRQRMALRIDWALESLELASAANAAYR